MTHGVGVARSGKREIVAETGMAGQCAGLRGDRAGICLHGPVRTGAMPGSWAIMAA